MGDRAQIVVVTRGKLGEEGVDGVSLYTHWGGSEIMNDLADALESEGGRNRANDPEYLARIIFCWMVGPESLEGETGFGIGTARDIHGDLEHLIPVVSPNDGCIALVSEETRDVLKDAANLKETGGALSFEQFIKNVRTIGVRRA